MWQRSLSEVYLKRWILPLRYLALVLSMSWLPILNAQSNPRNLKPIGTPARPVWWFFKSFPDNRYCPQTGTWTGGQYDGPAHLPEDCFNTAESNTPSPGTTINVSASADLNSIYATAQCGDTLLLAHGGSWTGPFSFAAKNCDDQHWITISTDGTLPPEGTRISPTSVANMAQITLKPGASPNTFGDHLRFVGIEWNKQAGAALVAMMAMDNANHIIFDRNYCHGNAGEELRRCIDLGSSSNYIAVIDSNLSELHCIAKTGTCTDSQAISGGLNTTTTVHGIKIVDNFLEASGENILFGGGAADGCGPVDVEIRRNQMYKPLSWNPADPSYGGIPYIVKNLLELKNGCRILFEGNLLQNDWGGYSQEGVPLVITPKNQDGANGTNLCALCAVQDLTIRYSYIEHTSGALVIANVQSDDGGWAAAGERYSIHDLIFDDLQYATCYGCGTNLIEISSSYSNTDPPPVGEVLSEVSLDHLTVITNQFLATQGQESAAFMLDGPPLPNVSDTPQMTGIGVTNWIIATGTNGTYPTGGGANNCSVLKGTTQPAAELQACLAGASLFAGNVLVGYPEATSDWPLNNLFASSWSVVGFANYNGGSGGDYHLLSSSPFSGTATDGTDPGANVDAVLSMTAGVQDASTRPQYKKRGLFLRKFQLISFPRI